MKLFCLKISDGTIFLKKYSRAMWPNIEQARAMMTFHKYSILIDLYDDFKKKVVGPCGQI
jgi:hypothetical protein